MAQVIALSTELGGDLRAIAIVQTVRILLLVIGLPNGLALFGLVAPAVAAARGPAGVSVLGEMILLVAVSTVFAIAVQRLRFPGGLLFGAMAGSAILHGSGYIHAVLPWWIGSSSVIVLGGVVGSRFANTSFRMLVGFLGAAFGSFAVSNGGGDVFRADRGAVFPIPDRQYRHRVCTRRAGYDDGSGAGAASRPGLCRGASSRAFSCCYLFGSGRRPPHRAAKAGALGSAMIWLAA
jgi:hypothetical protein